MTDDGQRIHVDPDAVSARPHHPAFVARPEGEPVYYGFPLLRDVEVDGFVLGAIAGFALDDLGDSDDDGTSGDALVGPDRRRAALVWDVEDKPYFLPIVDGIGERIWRRLPRRFRRRRERVGVYGVGSLRPMRSLDDARVNLAAIVPMLRREWDR